MYEPGALNLVVEIALVMQGRNIRGIAVGVPEVSKSSMKPSHINKLVWTIEVKCLAHKKKRKDVTLRTECAARNTCSFFFFGVKRFGFSKAPF